MAALHTVTVTCPRCRTAVQVPVVLTAVDDVDGRRRGAFEVRVRVGRETALEHACPTPDRTPNRSTAA